MIRKLVVLPGSFGIYGCNFGYSRPFRINIPTNVYRVEKRGKGPYYRGHGCLLETDGFNHPPPGEDGIGKIENGDYRCGFISMESLHEWFSMESLNRLSIYGYNISTYTSDDIILGGTQVVFNLKKAKLKCSTAITWSYSEMV